MAADKKPMIVIKKITVVAGGAHGGAWKVAFADFMTAMMAFFLVMWLVAQSSDAQRKNVADYFSSPSIIEYNFSNFGVELTLEKLFLDLVNEPLNTLQTFLNPMDRTPNLMAMGMKKIAMSYFADELGDIAEETEFSHDSMSFEIPDTYFFERGKTVPSGQFIPVMEKLKSVVAGLEDVDLVMTSVVYNESVDEGDAALAKKVAQERVDLLERRIQSTFEADSVDLEAVAVNKDDDRGSGANQAVGGMIKFELKQKKVTTDGRKPRPLADDMFGNVKSADASVYDNFVKQVSDRKKKKETPKKR